jgi:polyisoprenoid-binding protein YceI
MDALNRKAIPNKKTATVAPSGTSGGAFPKHPEPPADDAKSAGGAHVPKRLPALTTSVSQAGQQSVPARALEAMHGFGQTSWMNRRHPYRLLTLCIGCTLAPLAAHAASDSYRYDPVHSQIVFSIDHDGFSRPLGRLHIAHGWLRFDPDDWSRSSTELDIDMTSLDMGDAEWNAAVCKPSLLDCKAFPTAHFASTSVERKDATHGVLHGVLALRGVNRPIDIPFTVNRIGKTIYGMHTIAGFSAATSLDRTAFGITGFPHAIGHDVAIWLELEGIRDSQTPDDNKEHP